MGLEALQAASTQGEGRRGAKRCLFPSLRQPLCQRGAGRGASEPEEDGKQRERTDGSPSYGIKPVSKKASAPTAPLNELSPFSSTEERVKQSLGFTLTSPTALLDGGRAGTRPKNPASLLASYSIEHH